MWRVYVGGCVCVHFTSPEGCWHHPKDVWGLFHPPAHAPLGQGQPHGQPQGQPHGQKKTMLNKPILETQIDFGKTSSRKTVLEKPSLEKNDFGKKQFRKIDFGKTDFCTVFT